MKRHILVLAFAGVAVTQNLAAQTPTPPVAGRADTVVARPDCSAGPQGQACEQNSGTFTTPFNANGTGHRTLIFHELNTYGPSVNFGNSGGWTITHVIEAPHIVFGTSGIDQYEGASIVKNGTGDLAGLYFYVYGGGRAAQSDEGVTGMTVESGEINGYFHGTITGGAGRGATALTLTADPNAQHNWNATCDGCMLLDITKGAIAGSLNGKSIPFANTYLNQLPTSSVTVAGSPGSLPLTRAWCTTLAAIPPTATAGLGTSRTVSCTLGAIGGSTPAFRAGGVVTIAGAYYPEQATLTAVGQPSGGVQSLTLLARNPNPVNSVIFQGGIAGQSLSFDDNLAASGFRSSYYVFGSVDGVNLIYGVQDGGSVASDHRSNHMLPRLGYEAETLTSGFHLYPSAEVVANTAQPSAPMLEPNAVSWDAGDMVENPRFQSFAGSGIRDYCQQFTPTSEASASSCFYEQMAGSGISGTFTPFRLRNGNSIRMYRQGGGALDPVPAFRGEGPFGDLFQFHDGPSSYAVGYGSVVDILATANRDNTPFYLYVLPSSHGPGAAKVLYDPGALTISFQEGLLANTVGTTTICSARAGNANCGQAAAGSIAVAAGSSTLVVTTGAVTANSQILITPDTSLDAKLGITCNKNPAQAFVAFGITARDPGRSFTLSLASPASGGPNCYSYAVIN